MNRETAPLPRLAELLDRGDDPRNVLDRFELLLEDVCILSTMPPAARTQRATHRRAEALEDLDAAADYGHSAGANLRDCALLAWWEAELAADPALVEKLMAILTDEESASVNRNEIEWSIARNPLTIEQPDSWWQCDNCMTAFDRGVARAIVAGRDQSGADARYCASCIAQAASEARAPLE